MEGADTESLRKAAPEWSLAGDKQLLDMLQGLHERIVTKCHEANTSLEAMVTALDTASISLQNVNNRFMALSNSQFVESRVYDDDVDVATQEAPVKPEPPKPVDAGSELLKLKNSLRVLESYHEGVHIVDSDSESGSDGEEDRMVYKPKDLYADRPLPYIIGSYQWRSKWHAGLVPEQSDSDSDMSKPDAPLEQYSDSEPETGDTQTDKPHVSQRTISTNSSIGSELTIPTVGKPADIAAELARRLGGNVPHVPEPEPETPPSTVPTKVYRPQQPTTAMIFPDEPPPLDRYQSDQSYQSESEDDVFAELHKKNAKRTIPRDATGVVDELFANAPRMDTQTDGFADERRHVLPPVKQSSPLFYDPQESDLFAEPPQRAQRKHQETEPDTAAKKPVGGISLFGNNKGAESIGAAILKRNQRKNSTSEEESENESPPKNIGVTDKTKETVEKSIDKTQKDIITDLFTKPAKKAEKAPQKVEKTVSKKVEVPAKKVEAPVKKVDLFADDLFDDIDDIFTTIKAPVKETKDNAKKSLFDDEDDDLFANVAVSSSKTNSKTETKAKSIFDSDDDLFSDKNEEVNATKSTKIEKDKVDKPILSNNKVIAEKTTSKEKSDMFTENNTTKKDNFKTISKQTATGPEKSSIKSSKAKSIFDSDSDDDIFADFRTNNNNKDGGVKNENKVANVNKIEKEKTEVVIEDFENEDSLFLPKEVASSKITNVNASITNNDKLRSTKIDEVLDDDNDSLFVQKKKSPGKPITNTKKSNDEFEDDLFVNKKTDKILEESIENTPETKINSVIYSEQELFSSKTTENISRKDEISSVLSNTKVLNTQVSSPSLFDDDDTDNLFAKDSNRKTDNKVKPDISHKPKVENVKNTNSEALYKNDSDCEISKISEIESLNDIEFNDEIIDKIDKSKTDPKKDIESNLQPSLDSQNDNKGKVEPDNKVNVIQSNLETIDKDIKISKDTQDLVQETKPITGSKQDIQIPPNDGFDEDSVLITKESIIEQRKETKTEFDNKVDFMEEPPIFTEPIPVSNDPDIFSDIFSDVPPEFERPKEPKKSKNVNALFDDDSDDEALFFKKNDVVTDEIPNVSFGTQEDRLFHIFHDEPPAIDVDFTQKPPKSNEGQKLRSTDSEIHKVRFKNEFEESDQIDSNTVPASIPKTESNIAKTTDESKKPIGKLKPMNININVSSLLPGASPKKTKSNEQVDGQIISTSEVPKDDESKMVKSVSFEGDPDSEILDNKLSKERAKIQVKRRPSTRRARKEAVRKSGIDFGDDSTDYSSSTDISKKEDTSDKVDSLMPKIDSNIHNEAITKIHDTKHSNKSSEANERNVKDQPKTETSDTKKIIYNSRTSEQNIDQSKTERPEENPINIATEIEQSKITKEETSLFSDVETETSSNTQEKTVTTAYSNKPNVKSKVVYILNDEDIFTDVKPTTSKTKSLNIVDNDDELFSTNIKTNISTLGNAYKDITTTQKDIDNFDSDEDIFKASESKNKKNVSETKEKAKSKSHIDEEEAKIDKLFVKNQNVKTKSIFDDLSDQDDELFGSKSSDKTTDVFESKAGASKVKSKVEMPKVEVKGSLFDDDSDDDLFGVKTTKNKEPSQPASKIKEVISKSSEPVFEDPLSIFGQEDDL